ncbi:MAG: hypothetical protein ABUL58_07535 [Steroidobacter sp.]
MTLRRDDNGFMEDVFFTPNGTDGDQHQNAKRNFQPPAAIHDQGKSGYERFEVAHYRERFSCGISIGLHYCHAC